MFHNLPLELLMMIFDRLYPKDIMRFLLTNKELYYSDDLRDYCGEINMKVTRNVRYGNHFGLNIIINNENIDELYPLLSKDQNIHSMQVTQGVKAINLAELRIKRLYLYSVSIIRDQIELINPRSLRHLSLHHLMSVFTRNSRVFDRLRSLESLEFISCNANVEDFLPLELNPSCALIDKPNLASMQLKELKLVDTDLFSANKLRNITSLRALIVQSTLKGRYYLGIDNMIAIEKLQTLDLTCAMIDDENIKRLFVIPNVSVRYCLLHDIKSPSKKFSSCADDISGTFVINKRENTLKITLTLHITMVPHPRYGYNRHPPGIISFEWIDWFGLGVEELTIPHMTRERIKEAYFDYGTFILRDIIKDFGFPDTKINVTEPNLYATVKDPRARHQYPMYPRD